MIYICLVYVLFVVYINPSQSLHIEARDYFYIAAGFYVL